MNKRSIDKILEEYFEDGIKSFLSHVSINCVVFGYDHPVLKVLVNRLPGQDFWLLPGGYIKKEENINDAAYRNLRLSGIDNVFLRQIQTFGDAHRVPVYTAPEVSFSKKHAKIMHWVSRRFVTVNYYGLVNFKRISIVSGGLSYESKWMDVNSPDHLGLDHAKIINETRKILATELQNYPVASNLLPETFTLNELRGLYEAILVRKIDRGTFRRKILSMGVIEKTDSLKDLKGRPADIFRFNQVNYLHSLSEETKFGF